MATRSAQRAADRPGRVTAPASVIDLEHAGITLGGRPLWQGLDLHLKPGEFLAVLGPNGSGKTSLLRVLLGITPLSSGSISVLGQAPQRVRQRLGYIPQQKGFDPDLPVRGHDFVRLGLDGQRYGIGWGNPAATEKVREMIRTVGAEHYADAPIGLLSGGEQQRLRVAQALLSDPDILLCDEPLLSLDLSQQQMVMALIEARRQQKDMAVVFVTHDINPALPLVDRVLYLVGSRWAIGKPEDVLTTERLTELYGAPVDVLHVRGHIIVVGTGETEMAELGGHHVHAHHHHELNQ